jgi:pimeloyl-ACP methyl ester carboxylesterase
MATTPHLPSAPSLGWFVAEPLRAAFDYARTRLMKDIRTDAGDGHAVVFFPGLGADQRYMSRLKEHCRQLGYVCYDWGRGFNTGPEGDIKRWIAQLAADVEALVGGHSQSVSLIGWSLGGIYAREIAKILTTRVRQVITLGSPIGGIAESTNAAWLYRLLNGTNAPSDQASCRRLKTPPPVPTSSIYSRTDGVVAWRSCQVKAGPRAENIEVRCSHLGLVFHHHVFTLVANRLAQRAGQWRPWRAASVDVATHAIAA